MAPVPTLVVHNDPVEEDPEVETEVEDDAYFCIAHHDSKRSLPVSSATLGHARDWGYDSMTTPITTPHFHSRVLALLSTHLTATDDGDDVPAPIITPLSPVDTPLGPSDCVGELIGYSSPWIDLTSADPLIANLSRQVLNMEIAYASFCGLTTVLVPGPRTFDSGREGTDRLARFARAIEEALRIGTFLKIAVHLPMFQGGAIHLKQSVGDLAVLAREDFTDGAKDAETDLYGAWDAWNLIRTQANYDSSLSVALALPRQLPIMALQSRWHAEPVSLLTFKPATFLKNKGGHPVLSKSHQSLIARFIRLKKAPSLLLCDIGPIPALADQPDPTPAEEAERREPTAHLVYLRYLQRHQPSRSLVEKFAHGYQDFLQAPLQPLADNLESPTYEVFERDHVKYDWYEEATVRALKDWKSSDKVVVAVAGSGRGPLVSRALKASARTGVKIEMWALEKNPNAYVLLQRHNEETWGGVVNLVKSDMRAWRGPPDGKVDILISELLGSFADNELSPECLDGVQHVLSPNGISIPASYSAHISPIMSPRLFADIAYRTKSNPEAPQTPYVVMLHQIDHVAISVPGFPKIQQVWSFAHPLPSATLAIADARRGGGVSGGGGGSMAGGDGANEHNSRYARRNFVCKDRGTVHGIAGYFEAVLYRDASGEAVELSTRPDTIDAKSKDMTSWFPIYFPLKSPLYFPDDAELEISMWRQTDDRKVWYEWLVEAFVMVGPAKRVRVGTSETGSSRKNGCLM